MSRPSDAEALRKLPAHGIGLAPGVGPTVEHAGCLVDEEAADGAGPPYPLRPPVHFVSESREGIPSLLGNPALDIQPAGIVAVRLEGIGETVASKARRLNRLLRVHAEEDNVQESLQHCLRLHISSRGTKRHKRSSVS